MMMLSVHCHQVINCKRSEMTLFGSYWHFLMLCWFLLLSLQLRKILVMEAVCTRGTKDGFELAPFRPCETVSWVLGNFWDTVTSHELDNALIVIRTANNTSRSPE